MTYVTRLSHDTQLLCFTGAVSSTLVATWRVIGTAVPAGAVCGSVLWVDTLDIVVVEHQTIGTAELHRGDGELTVDILPAGGGVGEGRMGKGLSVRSDGISVGTLEPFNVGLGGVFLAFSGEGGGLLFSDTSTLSLIEDERGGTVISVREAVDAVVVLITNIGVLMVEETVGSVAALI